MEFSGLFDDFFQKIKTSKNEEPEYEFTSLFNEGLLKDIQKDIRNFAKVLLKKNQPKYL